MTRFTRFVELIARIILTVISSLFTLVILGFSLLPLSALLLALPAITPQESVLRDTVGRRSFLATLGPRLFALISSLTILITQLAVSVEVTTRLPLPEQGPYASIAQTLMPAPSVMLGETKKQQTAVLETMPPDVRQFFETPLYARLPAVMVQHWPVVVLFMYILDVGLLFLIGKVPFSYNLRNLRVRWLTNGMISIAFLFVIGLLVFLLAFVNGMNDLTQNTGVPGNVLVLSDGSTDELFSNLESKDIDNIDRIIVDRDRFDRKIEPVTIRTIRRDGNEIPLVSKETYYVVNQKIPHSNPPRTRFLQVRTVEDPEIASAVHNVQLLQGKWFDTTPMGRPVPCVIGEGIAETLGPDLGKKRLGVGDTFELGPMTWKVLGIMKSQGTTVGSEIWCIRSNIIFNPFGKEKHTTLVLRTDADTRQASTAFAWHLNNRNPQQKVKAYAEPEYFAEMTKFNDVILGCIVAVAVVLAIGGVLGLMTTMFASIAQRIRDIGVLRLLGFKRWQIMVSFMIESLAIAALGGFLGCLLCWIAVDGRSATSTLSGGGGGGGKSFTVIIDVSFEVICLGMLFALMMGRLGGLVPALSAMRTKILDTLR